MAEPLTAAEIDELAREPVLDSGDGPFVELWEADFLRLLASARMGVEIRNRALEEAALVADELVADLGEPVDATEIEVTVFQYQQATGKAIAKRIRALQSREAEDGAL